MYLQYSLRDLWVKSSKWLHLIKENGPFQPPHHAGILCPCRILHLPNEIQHLWVRLELLCAGCLAPDDSRKVLLAAE